MGGGGYGYRGYIGGLLVTFRQEGYTSHSVIYQDFNYIYTTTYREYTSIYRDSVYNRDIGKVVGRICMIDSDEVLSPEKCTEDEYNYICDTLPESWLLALNIGSSIYKYRLRD